MANWKNTSSKSVKLGQKLYIETEYQDHQYNSSNPKWLIFWRKITRAKRKSPETPLSLSAQKNTYDHQSYLQNFDDGSDRIEPDYLYRSFSARYANPSRLRF
ncbi:hypothetical protein CASFOL_000043 [Castilleja foliolosa]|uniref:Uncharacterized protein n=1 Tax=Castilleja foliolosa TaxID=1961234 RepID=A0ABD3EN37_9LAMI